VGVTLNASGGTSYKWSNGATSSSLSVSTAGTYTVTVIDGTCTSTASKTVTVNLSPNASIAASRAIPFCQGESVNLIASGGTSYTWSNGTKSASLSNITAGGTYTVTVSNGNCTATATRTITTLPSPVASISASSSTSFCQGGSVNLTASGGNAYLWSNGATTATLSNITTSNNYTVTITSGNGCVSKAAQAVTVNPIPVPSIIASGATTICENDKLTLTASGGTAYAWSNGVSKAVLTDFITSGNYTVTVSNGGCQRTASKDITVYPAPSVKISSTYDGTLGTATATVTGGKPPYTYTWNNNATNFTLIGLRSGEYKVTVMDANNCTKTAEVKVGNFTKAQDIGESIAFSISPVPNDGHFMVKLELPALQTVPVEIYNEMGQKMANLLIYGQSISESLDVSHLNAGLYLVKIKTNVGMAKKWIIIGK
jgi:Secretion system C-terminal sorting domain/SprB repeat